MDHDENSKYVPRAPRFKVADTSEVDVTVTRTGAGEDDTLEAALVDVSQHGVKLSVPIHLQFEEALQLEIKVHDSDLEYQGVASVRHIRAGEEDNWVMGCAIAPPISDEVFAYLATTAGKERRRFRRLPIAAEAMVRRQAETEGSEVTLHNLSSGGFCFSSDVQYEIGELVQLTIDDNEGGQRSIEASICWQVDGPDGSIAGCQFASRTSYAELCACLTEQPALGGPVQNAEPTSKLVLAAAVLAMLAPPMMTLFLQAKKVSAEASLAPVAFNSASDLEVDPIIEEPAQTEEQQTVVEVVELELESTPSLTVEQEEPIREWVDNTGKFRTDAKLVEVTAEHIVLEKASGKQATVPLRRLSEADHEYVQAWQSR